ncbi:unannotated protein [freshwater metagenome]|uniref:Unannotated protein n=1 Tax=freshwater metagenome TaxID=449393 RepID=A0A6J6JA87_9ZZZZ|nr:hypothetical protein [Actinomycetota bacterium]
MAGNLGTAHITTRLGPAAINISASPECEQLLDAFQANEVEESVPHLDLKFVENLPAFESASFQELSHSQHFRRETEHVWVAQKPRHVQTLSHEPNVSELLVDTEALKDGAIRARPAVDSISAWAISQSIFPLHASAVTLGSDALLFVGEGGRGKTTTALALAFSGWSLLADDRCFLTQYEDVMSVCSLYKTAILTPAIVERFPDFLGHRLGVTHEGKIACRLPKTVDFAKSARIRGVIAVSHGSGEEYQLERLDSKSTLSAWQQALVPSIQALGPTKEILSTLARAARTLPVWSLTLGWDFSRIDSTLRRHLDEIRTENYR